MKIFVALTIAAIITGCSGTNNPNTVVNKAVLNSADNSHTTINNTSVNNNYNGLDRQELIDSLEATKKLILAQTMKIVELEQRIVPRLITAVQIEKMASKLKPYAEDVGISSAIGAGESKNYGEQIAKVFETASWRVDKHNLGEVIYAAIGLYLYTKNPKDRKVEAELHPV